VSLFDLIEPPPPKVAWSPPELVPLDDHFQDIEIDFETNGLRWWAGDLPGGVGIGTPDGVYRYYPWGHRGGGNLQEEQIYRWCQHELKGKRLRNLNIRFDCHMARVWGDKMGSGGLDWEAMGCELTDVGHHAALLDDHRQRLSLEALIDDFLPDEQKVKTVEGFRMDTTRMMEYHAGQVAPRAIGDVRAVRKLHDLFAPRLVAEDLMRVKQLEDKVIYCVVEMEKNGTKIDLELLERWLRSVRAELSRNNLRIMNELGFQVNPKSNKDMQKVFQKLHLPMKLTAAGNPSFAGAVLKAIDNEMVKLILRTTQLKDLLSKLESYKKNTDPKTGILRYALNQLKAVKDEGGSNAKGTVSGRFSSTKLIDTAEHEEGMNIQSIMKAAKQRVRWGFDEDDTSHDDEIYVLRNLHIADTTEFKDAQVLSSDAMQIEYRLFAAETKSKRLIEAYEKDPLLSFHKFMWVALRDFNSEITYRRTKDINFAKIYGAGPRKIAYMMGFIDEQELKELQDDTSKKWMSHPEVQRVFNIIKIYNREIPEAKRVQDEAKQIAEERGYIRSILGRRSRFKRNTWQQRADGTWFSTYGGKPMRSHKALNTRIQPSAADINKLKLVELHAERKRTGFLMRYTVHDEVVGDARAPHTRDAVHEILNRQSWPIAVPILWDTGVGPNWAACG
jgi:DNA polymerase I-like protein with 3'-5' exonuclease and polymerase domains